MKNLNRVFCIVLALAMLISMAAVGFAESTPAEARVDTVSFANGDCFVYVPVASENLAVRTCTMPILVVMGDTDYTAESVIDAANASGIAQIAAEEGAVAVFLNSKGDAWSEEDVETFTSIFTMFSDSSGNNYVDGVTENGTYCGSLQRIYVFADGSAADFVAANFSGELSCFIDYGFYQANNDVTPSGIALFNTTAGEGDFYVVGEKFDAETTTALYASSVSKIRRQSGVAIPVPDMEALQLTESVVGYESSIGTITCYEYASDAFAASADGTVPLVLMFHGGGNHAQYFAWASGWMDIASEENVYLVSMDKHDRYTSAEVMEVLEQVTAKYPQIDTSRIYATGFSMGAVKCWNLAIKYPQIFAGILPCDAGYMSEDPTIGGGPDSVTYIEDSIPVSDVIVPIFYVAGGHSFTHEDVSVNEAGEMNNVGVILQRIFANNDVTDNYNYNGELSANWGIEPVAFGVVHNDTFNNDQEISYIASEDGNIYTALCYDVEKGHETYELDGYLGWAFVKNFSRNPDGTLNMAVPATYSVHVIGEDWGAVADYAIVNLPEAIEDASAFEYSVTETRLAMSWVTFSVEATTTPKTITNVYLCDEIGAPVEGPSAHVALEFYTSPNEGSPMFTNNANFGLNEWSDPYYLTITMECAEGVVVVEETPAAILTATEMYEMGSFTSSNGTEMQTALYVPEGGTDTVVVWLHGMGEGGNDSRIPIINADVNALVSEEFQTVMGGAAVLVPQCPIYWMDTDGTGSSYVNGGIVSDGTSFYMEPLHELIAAYAEQIGAEHIILAGCSNGGYMTMIMAMNYGTEYDAYVPICEAVSDSDISDEQIAALAGVPLYFIYAQNDPLVVPAVCEEPTIARLQAAGASDLHVFAPADVHDTTGRFVGEDGQPLQAFGHGSWQYFFNNEAVDADGVNCWAWMASHAE